MNFKMTLVVFLILISKRGISQLDQGNWLVGGNAKFYSYTNKNSSITGGYSNEGKYTEIEISPNIGYFIGDKVALGLKTSFVSFSGRVTSPAGLETNTRRLWVGPFGRYYFLDKEKTHNILLESSYQTGVFNGSFGSKGKLRTFSVLAGTVLYFNSSVGIEFLLGYSYKFEDIETTVKDIRSGLQIGIGLQFHLTK